jgi:hypothetical protein
MCVIVVRVSVSRGIVPFSPMGIDSAGACHLPNGEVCMDKSHLLQNNPLCKSEGLRKYFAQVYGTLQIALVHFFGNINKKA